MNPDTSPDFVAAGQLISPGDRSGVLEPRNLERFGAALFEPDPSVAPIVHQYWHVRWHLDEGETIAQRVIDLPAITLTIEDGDVPAPLVITGVQRGAWMRNITGRGAVFAIRLRPAGLAMLSGLSPSRVADQTMPLTPDLDPSLHDLLSRIALEPTTEARVRRSDEIIAGLIAGRSTSPEQLLANAAMVEMTGDVRASVGVDLANHLGVSERTVQRALRATVGHGPKWISRRIRLQEVARQLATQPGLDLATLAVDLGYTDQSHLTNDFKGVAGVSPDAYRRSLADLAG